MGCRLRGRTRSDTTEATQQQQQSGVTGSDLIQKFVIKGTGILRNLFRQGWWQTKFLEVEVLNTVFII